MDNIFLILNSFNSFAIVILGFAFLSHLKNHK